MILTLPQRGVLMALARGLGYKEVAYTLAIGERTVKKRIQEARRANNCITTVQLMFRYGLEVAG